MLSNYIYGILLLFSNIYVFVLVKYLREKHFNHEMRYLVFVFICVFTYVTAYQRINNDESYRNNSVLQRKSYLPDRLRKFARFLPPALQRIRAKARQLKKRKHRTRNGGIKIQPVSYLKKYKLQ